MKPQPLTPLQRAAMRALSTRFYMRPREVSLLGYGVGRVPLPVGVLARLHGRGLLSMRLRCQTGNRAIRCYRLLAKGVRALLAVPS